MKNNGLDIASDLKHQRRMWVVERVGWAVMATIVVAALAGLFGSGPLANATAGQPGSALHLEYERFGRYEAPCELRVHVGGEYMRGDKLRLWISREYLDRVEVERTMPPAEESQLQSSRVIYVFKLAQTNQPVKVTFHLRPTGYGKAAGSIGIADGPDVQFSQFIYP